MHYTLTFDRGSKFNMERDTLLGMHKGAFPATVRETLNDIVFDMKMRTMLPQADEDFDYVRSSTFIKAVTGFKRATGLKINNMVAGAGVMENKARLLKASKRLDEQGMGESLPHTYTPVAAARKNRSRYNQVSYANRHSNLKFIDMAKVPRGQKTAVYMHSYKTKTALRIKRGDRYVIAKPIQSTKNEKKAMRKLGRSNWVRLETLYIENEGRIAKLRKPRPFVLNAAAISVKRFDEFFSKNFEKRYNKYT